MGNANPLEWSFALLLLLPGTFVMTFPETWLALLVSLFAGWFRLGFGAAAAATVAAALYIAGRVAITGSGQGWNIATSYGWVFALGGALVVSVLFILGYLLARVVHGLVDRLTYG